LNFDFQVTKLTRISERQSIQLRAEFFNFFNHAQFGIPTNGVSGSADVQQNNNTLYTSGALFGVINQTSVSPRLIQLALKYSF
jgi:hypothetical protein